MIMATGNVKRNNWISYIKFYIMAVLVLVLGTYHRFGQFSTNG